MSNETSPQNSPGTLPVMNWKALLAHTDVLLAVGTVMIIAMMLIPLPKTVLDILLTLNIALGVTILLVTLYTDEPLQYSTFPTILLFATLFRLGLNVSSTRLILLNADAGEVIQSFGSFVIGGNYVVGLLIFIILVIINFIVITNGAGRVSEVAARFTLDAMPGKQISIDADLNAGIITEQEAKQRRQQIQKEADFYGTMDGASKFVKGDAIAGIIITIINIVGGLIIGVMQQKMAVGDAAATYTVLTVGDGLVSQLPALVISSATGILVTRVSATDKTLGDEIGSQMFNNAKILGTVAGLMGLLAIVPGMPKIPFILIAMMAGFTSYQLVKKDKVAEEERLKEAQQEKIQSKMKKKASSDNVMDLMQLEPIELEIGYRLVPLIESESGGDLLDRIAQIRRQVALDLGFVLPSVRVRDNLQLPPNQYNIKLRGVIIESGEVMADMHLAMSTDPDSVDEIQGIETKEPAFGLPALWIGDDQREEAEVSGYTVVSASAVVSTHLTEVIKRNAADIFSRADVQSLLNNVKKTQEPLVSDIVPDEITEAELHVVLQNLLIEKVSIRDMVSILEAIGYHVRISKDPDYLTEQCRMALSRNICKQHINPETGDLPILTLDPMVEEQIAQGLSQDGKTLSLSPAFTQNLFNQLNLEIERIISGYGVQPVLLCNARLRMPLRRLTERVLPQVAILSYNEIGPTVKATALGSVKLNSGNAPVME